MIVCALCRPVRGIAQTPISPEGWVVLPVDEYRALRERAHPQPPRPIHPGRRGRVRHTRSSSHWSSIRRLS